MPPGSSHRPVVNAVILVGSAILIGLAAIAGLWP
jgi:hypothetical protein